MAEVFYHGVGHSGDKRRYNELKSDLLAAQNERLKAMLIPKTLLIGELDGAEAQILRLIGESELDKGAKTEVLKIWNATRKKVMGSHGNWNAMLRKARAGGPGV
jgi:hypothetical protein